MRCKPGELAVITSCGPQTGNLLGAVIRVTAIHPKFVDHGPAWRYEGRPLKSRVGVSVVAVNDCCLTPIRPDEGDDETLTWAGKPETVRQAIEAIRKELA